MRPVSVVPFAAVASFLGLRDSAVPFMWAVPRPALQMIMITLLFCIYYIIMASFLYLGGAFLMNSVENDD